MIGWNLENGNGNNGHMVYPTAPFATPPHAASFSDTSTMPMSPNFAIETPKSTGNGMYFALLPHRVTAHTCQCRVFLLLKPINLIMLSLHLII